jgi:hypothetical protein
MKAPLKTKAFIWLVLANKSLTWDKWKKRACHGPRKCFFCKSNDETLPHLMITCPFTKEVWEEALKSAGGDGK